MRCHTDWKQFVTCDITPDASGCIVTPISSNTITYKLANPAVNASASISTVPTTSKCQKAHTVARFTNVSSNVLATGNKIARTACKGRDESATSIETIDNNGYVSNKINKTNTARKFGINSHTKTASYTDLDFAFYLQPNGSVTIYDN